MPRLSAVELSKYCAKRNMAPITDLKFKNGTSIRVLAGKESNKIDVFEKVGDDFIARKGYSGSKCLENFKNWFNRFKKDIVSGEMLN